MGLAENTIQSSRGRKSDMHQSPPWAPTTGDHTGSSYGASIRFALRSPGSRPGLAILGLKSAATRHITHDFRRGFRNVQAWDLSVYTLDT